VSLQGYSLLTGKRTGKIAEFAPNSDSRCPIGKLIQRLGAIFPTHKNREGFSKNREIPRRNRELSNRPFFTHLL
jgi:hypothetical protein